MRINHKGNINIVKTLPGSFSVTCIAAGPFFVTQATSFVQVEADGKIKIHSG